MKERVCCVIGSAEATRSALKEAMLEAVTDGINCFETDIGSGVAPLCAEIMGEIREKLGQPLSFVAVLSRGQPEAYTGEVAACCDAIAIYDPDTSGERSISHYMIAGSERVIFTSLDLVELNYAGLLKKDVRFSDSVVGEGLL